MSVGVSVGVCVGVCLGVWVCVLVCECVSECDGVRLGRDGASFCNDPLDKKRCNAEFISKAQIQGVAREGYHTIYRVFLRATKHIPPNTEIFASYGRNYWNDIDGLVSYIYIHKERGISFYIHIYIRTYIHHIWACNCPSAHTYHRYGPAHNGGIQQDIEVLGKEFTAARKIRHSNVVPAAQSGAERVQHFGSLLELPVYRGR